MNHAICAKASGGCACLPASQRARSLPVLVIRSPAASVTSLPDWHWTVRFPPTPSSLPPVFANETEGGRRDGRARCSPSSKLGWSERGILTSIPMSCSQGWPASPGSPPSDTLGSVLLFRHQPRPMQPFRLARTPSQTQTVSEVPRPDTRPYLPVTQ